MSPVVSEALIRAAEGAPFQKVTGGGNDFVLIDNRNGRFSGDLGDLVRRVCHRGLGVGADGMIFIEPSDSADLKMVYYNRDGGRADLCGNGLRCVARWASRTGSFPRAMRVETGAGVLAADGVAEPPWFTLPLGAAEPTRLTLDAGGRSFDGVRVKAGVPHFVVRVDDAFAAGVLDSAPQLRSHPRLGAEGANVDYFTPRGEGRCDVRFFERGVEAETLSSGSGSISVAVACDLLGIPGSPIVCRNREGLESRVVVSRSSGRLEATLAGEVRMLFRGRLVREMLA
ncbi:MAG: diaminopimelate epimerase [Acidobacteria bacterium]|nr:diaminopimelate epimerase [Acidobacteriota bacterium]